MDMGEEGVREPQSLGADIPSSTPTWVHG